MADTEPAKEETKSASPKPDQEVAPPLIQKSEYQNKPRLQNPGLSPAAFIL